MKFILIAILTLGSISSYANCDISVSSADVSEKIVNKLQKALKRQGYLIISVDQSKVDYNGTFAMLNMFPVPGGYQVGISYKLKGQNGNRVFVDGNDFEVYFPECVE